MDEIKPGAVQAADGKQTAERAALPIGAEEVRRAMVILEKYRAGKRNLERRIIENEQFWKLRHWEQMRPTGSPGDPQPASGWLLNVILNRHADAIDNYPEPNCLPRAVDDEAEARKLTKILPVILRQNGFAQVYSDCWWYKLKTGTGVYGVFWDQAKLNGMGDVTIRKCDILNLFWQPGITDIQKSRNLFHVELVDNEVLEETYPQLKGKLQPSTGTVSHYFYDDTVDTTEKTPVIDWYYKRRAGGRDVLHYCKFCGETVLFATENQLDMAQRGWYDHGKYPFVFDVLFPEEGTPCGFGYIDICKDPQKQIDLMNQAMLKNTLAASTPRFFVRSDGSVNEAEFADWSRPFVHTEGSLGEDSILPIQSTPLGGAYLTFLQMKTQELRETSGNVEANTGSVPSSVTAASAIAALQEASGKLSRDMVNATYRAFEEICLMLIDLIRQFYELPRQFRITGEMGRQEFVSYDNAGLRPRPQGEEADEETMYISPVIDIEVTAQDESRYNKAEYNELALRLYGAGLFNPQMADQAISCLSMMDFKGIDAVRSSVRENGTLLQQVAALQQTVLRLSQIIDAEHGSRIADSAAAEFTGQPVAIPTPGVAEVPQSERLDTQESYVTAKARAQTQEAAKVR
ncbi:MAG: hypothetical protein J5482_02900 [Oscillospiraceae bacterium]|nr:hypothetical protein [Oscillospiraceae bacterium]